MNIFPVYEDENHDEVIESTAEISEDDQQEEYRENVLEGVVTRTGREIKKPLWLRDYETSDIVGNAMKISNVDFKIPRDPKTTHEALSSGGCELWKQSMLVEIENLLRNKTWEFVILPKGRRSIKSKWVFKTKFDENGKPERYKSRVMALGNYQRRGLDYDNTYAPVVQKKSMRILFAVAAKKKWVVDHVDIQAAYLLADLEDEVYMDLPEAFKILSDDLRLTPRLR